MTHDDDAATPGLRRAPAGGGGTRASSRTAAGAATDTGVFAAAGLSLSVAASTPLPDEGAACRPEA